MPVDLYGSIRKTSQWAFDSPILNNILASSLFVAVSIALIMVLIVMIMYPAQSGTSILVVIKMFIYMFLSSLLIVFLHDGVMKFLAEEKDNELETTQFMQNTTLEGRANDPAYQNLYKKVQINGSGEETNDSNENTTDQNNSTNDQDNSTDSQINQNDIMEVESVGNDIGLPKLGSGGIGSHIPRRSNKIF